ncbi:hypothetical protein ACPEEZ_01755 [Frigoribacterium sp. 2-23]|uniref:hypothetical protein n=1 Tax=Frigoribacterium sp. 2-23 TaxID=3415006 RepID=UPI003C6F8F25
MSPRTEQTHAAWRAALDELEALVAEADASLSDAEPAAGGVPTFAVDAGSIGAGSTGTGSMGAGGRWTPPTGLGPLPADLATRASSLVERQGGVIARLEAARLSVLQHLGFVGRVERSHEPERPVYLDVVG